jgi:hypothetical protein
LNKVKRATRLSPENQVPLRGYYRGHPPQKKLSHFSQKPHFKYAKYDSIGASGEFMQGVSGQRGKTRKLEIAYASRRILSYGEIWTAHEGVNPCGFVVQRGGV